MIGHVLWRGLVVIMAFCVAAPVALVVLFTLGAVWVGDELRTAAPDDPLLRHGSAAAFGAILFTGTVASAMTALPACIAVVVSEVLHLRSWIYYVLGGGAALVAIPLLAGASLDDPTIPASEYMTIFATSGFAGGFVYWLLASARA